MITIIKFKELPKEEKPRERLLLYGSSHLTNEELLMIILKSGTKKKNIKELSTELLIKVKGIKNLANISYKKLQEIEGIGKVKAIELLAVIELSKRITNPIQEKNLITLNKPEIIIKYFNNLYKNKSQEEFYCIYLDNKQKYLTKKRLFIGTINTTTVHPREIFKEAYIESASYIICLHNHPSGDPTPSKEDIVFTKNLQEIGKLHAIYLIDHIIIGKNCYFSFYENKYL